MEIQNGDVRLHVEVDGDDGAPPVLLLHGITSSVRTWDWLVPDLVETSRVIRLDFRGHGGSGRAPGAYVADGWLSDAAAACREVAGVPCAVIGHSLGGGAAFGLAQRHPELVRGVVGEDPALGMPRGVADKENSLFDAFRLMRESIPRLQESGITVEVLAGILADAPGPSGGTFGERLHADACTSMAAGMLALDASVLDPVLAGAPPSMVDLARPVTVPSLVVAADPTSPDCVARPELTDQILATSSLAEVRILVGAGHLIHDELAHRAEFRTLALDFLARLA